MSGRLVEVAEDSVRGGFFLFAGKASLTWEAQAPSEAFNG